LSEPLLIAQVAFGPVVGEAYMGLLGEQQDGPLVALEAFPEIVRVGLGDPAALAVLPSDASAVPCRRLYACRAPLDDHA